MSEPHQPGESSDDSLNQRASALERFFAGLSEYIFFGQLGVADVQLVDYLSDMMLRFVRTEQIHRVRRSTGQPVTEVVQMLVEAEQRIGLARREVHRHIGDFTLFWSGMYPESLRKTQSSGKVDGFVDYCKQGKRAYAIAATIEGGEQRPPSVLLQRLSEEFEMCAYGLREIRREWEERDDNSSGGGLLIS